MEIFTLTLGYCATNTYIIIDSNEAIVVDPADDGEYIAEFITSHNAAIKYILITHGHFDHIGAARELQKRGALLYMSETDYNLVDFENRNSIFCAPPDKFLLDVAVHDGDAFTLIGHTFKVISTSGHTPGGVCYIMDDKTIFSGDTLFRLSIGRTDFAYGNRGDLLMSIKKLYELPHDYEVLPGHDRPTTLDYERKNNPYARY
ncbi:MAG: MBL fold metallo-hydrolase [Clostridiales bacterium]|nr:MBL fold metallo-hydrolase [Clostridiales bacterium]